MNSGDNFMSFGEIPNMSLDFFVFNFKSNLCTSSGSTFLKRNYANLGFSNSPEIHCYFYRSLEVGFGQHL